MAINPICRYCTHYDSKRLDCEQEVYSLFYGRLNIKPTCFETKDKYKKHPFISKLRLMVCSNEFLEACGSLALIAWGIIALLAILIPKPHNFIFVALFAIFAVAAIFGFFAYLIYSQVCKPIRTQWKLVNSMFIEQMKNTRDAKEDEDGN